MPAPGHARQERENLPPARNKPINTLRKTREGGRAQVKIQEQRLVSTMPECAESGFGPAEDRTIRFDQVDCRLESLSRKLRESYGNRGILERHEVDFLASRTLPSLYPDSAEVAIPVED